MVSLFKEDQKDVREHLLDLYLDVKVRSNDELDDNKLAEERQKLRNVASNVIIDYIRSSIEILLNLKNEDLPGGGNNGSSSNNQHGFNISESLHNISINSSQSNVMMKFNKKKGQNQKGSNYNLHSPAGSQSDYNRLMNLNDGGETNKSMISNSVNHTTTQMGYEEQMQQYEADIRNHISIEQQLKIYIDNLKYKMECDEKELIKKEQQFNEQISQLQKDKARLDELMSLKDKDLDTCKDEIKLLKDQVTSIETKNEKMRKESLQVAESKFKIQMSQMQEELDKYKTAYQSQHLTRQYSNMTAQRPFNNQFEGIQQSQNNNNSASVNAFQYQTSNEGMNNGAMQLVNFYANEDQNLIGVDHKSGNLPSGHKKNQLSLQSNKSTGKILTSGYAHTLSTHQSTQGVKDHQNQINQNFHNTVQSHQKYQPQANNLMGISNQISFTNPRNSTAMETNAKIAASHNSMESSKQSKTKTMIKNHSEYFVTNPNVRELVENSQKSFRNKAAQLLNSQGALAKKSTVNKSPEKSLTKTSLYKMTMQKSQEKFQTTGLNTNNKRLSNKPSKERNLLQQSTQMSQASFNQSLTSQAHGHHHRRSKTGAMNSFLGISNTVASTSFRPTANNSYQRSRENSQSNNSRVGISGSTAQSMIAQQQAVLNGLNMMPANNQASYSFIKNSNLGQGRTIQGPVAANFNLGSLQTYSIDNYDIQDDNTHKIPHSYQMKEILNSNHFNSLFDEDAEKAEKEKKSLDGGTQHIKSMKNLKATILGSHQHIKQPTKFKVSEKDIQYRNNQIHESQIETLKKMQSSFNPQNQRAAQGLAATSVLTFSNSLTGTQQINIPTQSITINHSNNINSNHSKNM
eukprot:403336526